MLCIIEKYHDFRNIYFTIINYSNAFIFYLKMYSCKDYQNRSLYRNLKQVFVKSTMIFSNEPEYKQVFCITKFNS